jgi:glycosyltransferase involved in cell wall biosynthesis
VTEPLVSALVSTYGSAHYLRGCLDDLLAQTLADQLEIIVVDAGSPDGEQAIVREYQDRFPRLHYLRTAQRECSSTSLNRATALARGRYLTTANTDDRHHPDFLRRMTAVLEQRPQYGLVYADSLLSPRDNETWAAHSAARQYAWPDYTHTTALSCCLFGAQPVWRRSVHDTVGLWDPSIRRANDQDMFLRIALRFGAVHLPEPLGLFRQRSDSNSGQMHQADTVREVMAVLRQYRSQTALPVLFPGLQDHGDPLAWAAAWLELGNLCALGPYTDAALALQCYQRALALPVPIAAQQPLQQAYANNTGCLLAAAGELAAAQRALVLGGQEGRRNQASLAAAGVRRLLLRQLAFASLPHAVVQRSRQATSVRVDTAGQVHDLPPRQQLPWDVYDGPNGVPWPRQDHSIASNAVVIPSPAATRRRILLVMYGWDDSGGGTMLPRAYAESLAATGVEVAVFYAMARPEPGLPPYTLQRRQHGAVSVYGLCNRNSRFLDLQDPAREVDDPPARAAFETVLDEFAPDLVHFWNLHSLGMSLPAACKQRGLPTVLSSNNYWTICPRLYLIDERLQRCSGSSKDGRKCAACLGDASAAAAHAERKLAGQRMLREQIDLHLAVSNRVRDLYLANGDDPVHLRVLRQEPPSVAAIWQQTGSQRAVVTSLQRPLRVGYLGSVLPHKGVHVLVEAMQQLPAEAAVCVVLGDVDASYLHYLRQLDRGRRVHFQGRYAQAQMADLLRCLDVVVVPSVWDDCAPFVVAEALAARCPVVGSALGGIPDFVQPDKNGLLVPPGNASALAAALGEFTRDRSLLGRLQRGIEPPRGLVEFTASLVGVYEELLAGREDAVALAGAVHGGR